MIIDGVNAGMSVQGHEINAADGAANFTRAITKPFARAGAAVVSRDHLPKNTENTPDAFDSVHKGGRAVRVADPRHSDEAIGSRHRRRSQLSTSPKTGPAGCVRRGRRQTRPTAPPTWGRSSSTLPGTGTPASSSTDRAKRTKARLLAVKKLAAATEEQPTARPS